MGILKEGAAAAKTGFAAAVKPAAAAPRSTCLRESMDQSSPGWMRIHSSIFKDFPDIPEGWSGAANPKLKDLPRKHRGKDKEHGGFEGHGSPILPRPPGPLFIPAAGKCHPAGAERGHQV
ncbi:MAG TPA: hypothetical protein VNT25_07895, partial [Allosphingosinicella sp.]|nr:hypothetical protein [Allosphingosinicella sp.]